MVSLRALLSGFKRSSPSDSGPEEKQAYSFSAARDWEGAGEPGRFCLLSPKGDAMLTELVLKEQPRSETLEEANERANFFNNRVPDRRFGTPKSVSGPGWRGLLQSQVIGGGGHEFQLVLKTSRQTLVFYLASPPGLESARLGELEGVILSLAIGGRR